MNKFLPPSIAFLFSYAALLIFAPSCVKYHELSQSEFPQGDEYKDSREIAHNYVRSAKVLDQFSTQAIFDALWLSDQTRTAFIDVYSKRRGKNTEKREALLKRQLEENNHWISFYVLADIRNKMHFSLNDKNSHWTLYLEVHKFDKKGKLAKKRIEPLSIKEVEVEPEYQSFFGAHRYSLFKNTFLVRFPMQNLAGKPYLEKGDELHLVVSSPQKKTSMIWDTNDIKKHSELLRDEDYYWL